MLFFLTGFLFLSLSFADVMEAPSSLIDFEQNPSSIDWKKIDSTHFEIIFPAEVEHDAQRVTHLLEKAYPLVTKSLEALPPKISLVLQNQSTISNGFVTLAPRRSEWYLSPSVNPQLTNTEWLKTLAVHEFRHVVQFEKSNRSFNKVFKIWLGEIGQALGLGLTMPPWFLEGDAVGTETALTKGGRGRLPIFERNLKALMLSGRDYDYDQAHLGSYKNYIPNHYVYGYFYTSYMKNNNDERFVSRLINESAASSYNPFSFYNAYARVSGEKFEKFYRNTVKDMIKNWKEKEASLNLTPYEVKNLPVNKDWTNYSYPQAVGKNKYLALKSGLSDIDQFVITDGKEDKTILYPGALQEEYPFKVRGTKLAWVEWELDPRWGYRDFSRVRVYDLMKKEFVTDLRQTKARLAVLDHSGEFILYVNWGANQEQHIVVTNLKGKEVYKLKFPRERVITSLDWLSLNEVVMVVKDMNDQKEIVKLSLLDQVETKLLPQTLTNIGFVTTYNGRVLVESPLSGIDNIYEVKNLGLTQLTSSRFGAYAPQVVNDELIYNDYTQHGMNIVSKKLTWDEEQKSQDSFVPVYEKFTKNEITGEMDEDFFAKDNYPVSSYSQVKNSINLHSWFLLAPPLSSIITVQGFSRDILNKFTLSAGANYDLNEQETQGFVSAAWSHYYPVFDIKAAYGGRTQEVDVPGADTIDDHWEEGTFEAGMQIPWRRITGRFTQNFSLRGFGKLIKVTGKSFEADEVTQGALFSPGAQLQYSITSRLARRDLNPDYGLALYSHFEEGRDTTGVDMKGSLFTADGRLYLPGFMRHHSFFHQYAYEKQREEQYRYSSLLLKPRGTKNVFVDEAVKYSANYMFPLFYPDWHWDRWVYLKRVSMNLFYDEMNAGFQTFNYHAASTGWEVLMDTHFLRIFVPITLGVRGNYVLDGIEKKSNYEIFVTTIGGYF